MDRKHFIESRLTETFRPLHLEVVDETHQHDVPPDAQSHFKVVLVSPNFEGVSPVQRHRQVNRALNEVLADGLHALALHTMTPEEWFAKGGQAPDSPPCLGGDKARS